MSAANKFLNEQRNYVNHLNYYYFTNAFTPEEIKRIIEIGEKHPKQSGTTVGNNSDEAVSDYRISEIAWLNETDETAWNPGGNIIEVPKALGTIVFFPSFLLHRVTPLTGGVRKSLVTWFCGANLR